MRHGVCAGFLLLAVVQMSAQEPVIPVPSTITVDGVPAIPASLAERLAQYGEFRSARFLSWHPTGRRMLVSTALGPRVQVHVVDGPGMARTQLTFGAAVNEAWYEPVGGDFFVFRRDPTGGAERPQLYRYDLDTRAVTLLTDGTSRNGGNAFAWSRKSGLIAFDSNRRTKAAREVWVMDPREPSSARLVLEGTGNWYAQDWSPDGRELLVVEHVSSDAQYIWRVEVKTGVRSALTPREGEAARWQSPRFSPDGRTVYALSDHGGDVARVWRTDAARVSWTPLTPEGKSVETYALSPDGRTLAVVFDEHASVLELIDARTLATRRRPKVPVGSIRKLAWHPDNGALGFELQSIHTLSDVYSVAAASGQVTRWTFSESGGVNPDALPAPEIIRWKSFDGLTISGVLYRPPARFSGPRPVIINIHGGPEMRERPRFLGRSASFLNELGIALVYPNVRGSDGFGRSFLAADNSRHREDAVKDIGALLDWIGQQPSLDEARVMVLGASYGGYMTYAAAAAYGDRIRCASTYAAISNFISYLEQTEPVRLANRRAEYGDERDPGMRDFLRQISPIAYAARIRTPLFIAHGGKDTRVPLGQAQEMVQALRRGGVPVWFAVYEDEGHAPLGTVANDFNQAVWVMFVQKYLLN